MITIYPTTPPGWWCGEFKGSSRPKPPWALTFNDPVEACGICRFWLVQSDGEGYCRRYPPTLKEGK